MVDNKEFIARTEASVALRYMESNSRPDDSDDHDEFTIAIH